MVYLGSDWIVTELQPFSCEIQYVKSTTTVIPPSHTRMVPGVQPEGFRVYTYHTDTSTLSTDLYWDGN